MGASDAVSDLLHSTRRTSVKSERATPSDLRSSLRTGTCHCLQVYGVDMIIMGFGYAMLCLRWSLRACAARLRLDAEPGVSNGGEC